MKRAPITRCIAAAVLALSFAPAAFAEESSLSIEPQVYDSQEGEWRSGDGAVDVSYEVRPDKIPDAKNPAAKKRQVRRVRTLETLPQTGEDIGLYVAAVGVMAAGTALALYGVGDVAAHSKRTRGAR